MMQTSKFADFSRGIFFLIASVSMIILMIMFIFVWQPIWTKGFKDFHTISSAIAKLDQTAKPASEIAPLMLDEMSKMNGALGHIETTMLTMEEMRTTMKDMHASMKTLEQLNPNIVRMNQTIDHTNQIMSAQMGRMNYEVDQMGDKFSPFGMMPFNW